MMKRMMSLFLALILCAVLPAVLAENAQDNAMDEEDSATVYTIEPGSYEWYMVPADVEDDHAYIDIYPTEELVQPVNGMWNYSFTMQEVGGYAFHPYTVTIIGFSDDTEISRETFSSETFSAWWTGVIPADSLVTYTGAEHNTALTALAISLIGMDETGYEQEFHSIIFLGTIE